MCVCVDCVSEHERACESKAASKKTFTLVEKQAVWKEQSCITADIIIVVVTWCIHVRKRERLTTH